MAIQVTIAEDGNLFTVSREDTATVAGPTIFSIPKEDCTLKRTDNAFTMLNAGQAAVSFIFSEVVAPVTANAAALEVAIETLLKAQSAPSPTGIQTVRIDQSTPGVTNMVATSTIAGTQVRDQALSNAAIEVNPGPGRLTYLGLTNPNTIAIKVPFYDEVTPAVVVGTTPIAKTVYVGPGEFVAFNEADLPYSFATAISTAAVMTVGGTTSFDDADAAAPTLPIRIEVQSK